jgi:hypothetical protein
MCAIGVALNGLWGPLMIIQTTKLASGGILAPVFGGVNGVVQWGHTPMVCTLTSGCMSLPCKKVEVDIL